MASTHALFEVSWEVCNKVGGIHTVISTKAKTVVENLGDDYVAIGPWLLGESDREPPLDEEPGYQDFAERCRAMGVPVRIGRWRIPGRPLTLLVEFSGLYEEKDDLLADLWERYEVDSISGGWDYLEPLLFGFAAARVIELWWEERLVPFHRRGVAHFHEWMTGSGLLTLREKCPALGTVFTTHATMLGRALSSQGHSPEDGLGDSSPEDLAIDYGVTAKHSIEGVSARQADVFTTVSGITANEAELLHDRLAEPRLPNGIDLDVVDQLAGSTGPDEARAALRDLAGRFLGEDVSDAAFLCISGRYEFHNKGIDLLLDALGQVAGREGRRAVLWVLVPAGNSGVRSELLERLEGDAGEGEPLGVATHNLSDPDGDPVHRACAELGLDNAHGSRVMVIQVPIYLDRRDGFLNLPYEAVLRGMDLSCFPSYYEPWGYTPQESLAVGVPTVTTDYAGFGRWAREAGLGTENGLTVLSRVHVEYGAAVEQLADVLEEFLAGEPATEGFRATCRETAARSAWSDLFENYREAYALALDAVQGRLESGVPQARRPRLPIAVQPAPEGRRPRLVTFDVAATLPEELAGLRRLAWNFAWCWDPDGRGLFQELSPRCWKESGHNPILFLRRVFAEDLETKAADADYVARLSGAVRRLDDLLAGEPALWAAPEGSGLEPDQPVITREHPVAYFCAEFGVHDSLPVYSGGLGVLAGDHLKSASDLNLPMVAVGLFYRMGYLAQRLDSAGEQIAVELENDPRNLPLELVLDRDGRPLEVVLKLPARELFLRAHRLAVGRVTLYLLDADTPSNRPEDRGITRKLYGGDREMRLKQEICLGRGGARLLRRLGIEPAVYHINEGHAAFLTLERVSQLEHKQGLTFEQAREVVRATTVFTTHTPVPAGHDRFAEDLMRRYFSDAPDWVGLPWERFYALGGTGEEEADFNMTYLALRFSSACNGVSRLHGQASRRLLHPFWPSLLESEVPVRSVTNGVHLATWTGAGMARALGVGEQPVRGADFAERAALLAESELWRLRREAKQTMLDGLRGALEHSLLERHDSPVLLDRMLAGLDPDALWIGFARRFAPYKRSHLLFADRERLLELLNDSERPVRIVLAGKAHPDDGHGKELLRGIAEIARSDEFVGRVFFAENYGMVLAASLVSGVDVWLNTPTRMLEASGTSGMKAAANGALNLSIGDGWWPEAADGDNGWTIAGDRVYDEQGLQDQMDSSALYRLLEEEVVPLYFEREDGVPGGWLERVRHSLATIPPAMDSGRMVAEYADGFYRPLAATGRTYDRGRRSLAKARAGEAGRVRRAFESLRIVDVRVADLSELKVGDAIDVRVELELGDLRPDDVRVELVFGHAIDGDDLTGATVVPCSPVPTDAGRPAAYEGHHAVERSGSYAYGVRVRVPESVAGDSVADLVRWA